MPSDKEKTIIKVFLRGHNTEFNATYAIVEWPEETERAKRSAKPPKLIDALAVDSSGRRLTLEHTIIEAFEDATASDARFKPLVSSLRVPSRKVPRSHIIVYMPLDCMDGMTAAERKGMADGFVVWFDKIKLTLSDGISERKLDVCGRRLTIRFCKHRRQDNFCGLITLQRYPKPDFLSRLRKSIDDKLAKLHDFRADHRILLLEQRDYDTPNFWGVHDGLKQLEGPCSLFRVDQICLADTSKLIFGDCAGSRPYVEFNCVWPTVNSKSFREQVEDYEMKVIQSEK
jgi:hypothetical protein